MEGPRRTPDNPCTSGPSPFVRQEGSHHDAHRQLVLSHRHPLRRRPRRGAAAACADAGIERPLFVTDRGLASLPMTQAALDVLEAGGLGRAVFSGVDANPTEKNLDAGVAAYRAGDHDGVVAFGGGSALDLGKMVAFMAGQTRPVWDFEDVGDWWTRADADAIAPTVAVPTTAGTGSEVGRASVITNSETHVKKIIFHPKVLPVVVIADPELTVGMPKPITAGTGMDALAHCLEAYCSPFYHPHGPGHRAGGDAPRPREPLPRLRRRRRHRGARPHDGGRLHGGHGVPEGPRRDPRAEPPGGRGLRHPPRHHQRLRHALRARHEPPCGGGAPHARRRLSRDRGRLPGLLRPRAGAARDLGIPKTLGAMGVTADRLDDLTAMALDDPTAGGNPVPMTAENTRKLLEACF